MVTGNDFEAVKWEVKKRAMSRGYPGFTAMDGEAIPKSEGAASVEECALLIEEIQQLSAEYCVLLPEYSEEEYETGFEDED
jgi:hypothetical protein